MRVLVLLIATLASCWASTSDVKKVISVEGRVRGPQTHGASRVRNAAPRVYLNGGEYSAIVRMDGSFTIPEVPVGAAYLLEIVHHGLFFEQVRVSILRNGDVRASLINAMNGRNDALPYPLFLEAKGRHQYFEIREGFNFGMIWKNPMILMMGFSMVMMFMMKYLVDPEQMKEMREQMAEQGIESQGDMMKAMFTNPELAAGKPKKKKDA